MACGVRVLLEASGRNALAGIEKCRRATYRGHRQSASASGGATSGNNMRERREICRYVKQRRRWSRNGRDIFIENASVP